MTPDVRNKELTKRLKQILQHITRMRKKLKENNMWLIAGYNALAEPTDEAQHGPMITRLYELVDDNRRFLREKKK